MRKIPLLVCGIAASIFFFAPLSASAIGFSFGGRIVAVVPCSGGMRHVTIAPAGVFPVTYIWTPTTVTYSVGRPRFPGQQILGVADIPFVCFIGGGGIFSSPIPLYGFRMQTVGTSPLI